jgi:hypothetical protein
MRFLKISCFVFLLLFFAVSEVFSQYPHPMSIIAYDMMDVECVNMAFTLQPINEVERTNISNFIQENFLDAIKCNNWKKIEKAFYPAMIDARGRQISRIKADKLLSRVKILKDKIAVFESELVFGDIDKNVKLYNRSGMTYNNHVYVPLDMRDDYSVKLHYKGKYCKGKSVRMEEKNTARPMFVLVLEELRNGTYWIYNVGYVQEKAEYWKKKNIIPEIVIPYYKGEYFQEYNGTGRTRSRRSK